MAETPPPDLIVEPLTPTATHGVVEIKDPPEAAMKLSTHAAEVSGLRLLDAADQSRRRDQSPRPK
jgi:hypothetical protein